MRLTCRPPDRFKPQNSIHRPTMAAIPPSLASPLPFAPPLDAMPSIVVSPPATKPQFLSPTAPPSQSPSDSQMNGAPSPPPSLGTSCPQSPPKDDVLHRIVKNEGAIKKKSKNNNHAHHFKTIKGGTFVPPPPLSKYKRPAPIIPKRPGDRYPLGIPYDLQRDRD